MEEIREKIKDYVGNLLYENGVHQREEEIFEKANEGIQSLLDELLKYQEDRILTEFRWALGKDAMTDLEEALKEK